MDDNQDVNQPRGLADVTDQNMEFARSQWKLAAQLMLVKIQMSLYEAGLLGTLCMEVS